MLEKRQTPRFKTMGRARLDRAIKGDVYLKDISITGCCLEQPSELKETVIKPDEKFKLIIKPESASHVGSFNLEVECKWICKLAHSFDFGFQIIVSPEGRHFQRYVDYLAYKSHKDDYEF